MKSASLIFLLGICLACDSERVQNTKQLAQEMSDRQIKRVTDAQLTATVDEWGKAIVAKAQNSLTAELAKKNQDSTVCNLDGVTAIQQLEKQYAIHIDLLGANDVKNPVLAPKERELVDAYLYNAENKLAQSDNVQKINDTLLIYNAPVPTSASICRVCTDNAALPFAVWRVVFSKREVIRRINPKKKPKVNQ